MHKNREAVWLLDVTLVELDVHLQAEVVASVHEEVACVPPNDDGDVERAFIRRRVKGEGEPCFKHFLVVVKVETLRTLYVRATGSDDSACSTVTASSNTTT
jgi:hypothetical protein